MAAPDNLSGGPRNLLQVQYWPISRTPPACVNQGAPSGCCQLLRLPAPALQVQYSLIYRAPETNGVLEACRCGGPFMSFDFILVS